MLNEEFIFWCKAVTNYQKTHINILSPYDLPPHESNHKEPKALLNGLYAGIKSGAKRRHISFNVDETYLYNLLMNQDKKCKLSGVYIRLPSYHHDYNRTASIDRLDCNKCYEPGNVQWVHKRINMMKYIHNNSDFIQWCKLIANYQHD